MIIDNNHLVHNGRYLPIIGEVVDFETHVFSDHGQRSERNKGIGTLPVRFSGVTVDAGDRQLTYAYCNCSCYYSVVGNRWANGEIMQPRLTQDKGLGLLTVSADTDTLKVMQGFSDRLVEATGSGKIDRS